MFHLDSVIINVILCRPNALLFLRCILLFSHESTRVELTVCRLVWSHDTRSTRHMCRSNWPRVELTLNRGYSRTLSEKLIKEYRYVTLTESTEPGLDLKCIQVAVQTRCITAKTPRQVSVSVRPFNFNQFQTYNSYKNFRVTYYVPVPQIYFVNGAID